MAFWCITVEASATMELQMVKKSPWSIKPPVNER
jgi:hypothetical protein